MSLSTPSSQDENAPVVYYLNRTSVEKLESHTSTNAAELPEHLVLPPGVYTFAGKSYALQKEGLYRLAVPTKVNVQRIVHHHDTDALLSALSWIVTHGNADNKKSNDELSVKALDSKLSLTCGKVSQWAAYILGAVNITSRLVAGVTSDDWNTYDNGHVLLEVWRAEWKKWVVYDVDNNSYFTRPESEVPLSLLEFCVHVPNAEYTIHHISADTRMDIAGFTSPDGYDYNFIFEAAVVNIKEWYQRVMQVPLIYDETEEKYLFAQEKAKDWLEQAVPTYKYIEMEQFMEKFYQNGQEKQTIDR